MTTPQSNEEILAEFDEIFQKHFDDFGNPIFQIISDGTHEIQERDALGGSRGFGKFEHISTTEIRLSGGVKSFIKKALQAKDAEKEKEVREAVQKARGNGFAEGAEAAAKMADVDGLDGLAMAIRSLK